MEKRLVSLFFLLMLACARPVAQLRIAVAASTEGMVRECAKAFQASTGTMVEVVPGASGTLATQIIQGAPFDLFISADTLYPGQLIQKGFGVPPARIYAIGSVVLWSRNTRDLSPGLRILTMPAIRRIAIANPRAAPYGTAAQHILSREGLWDTLQKKIVYGESVMQVNHFMLTGAVDVAITARSSIPVGTPQAEWIVLDHTGISQAAVLLVHDHENDGAKGAAFLRFLLSKQGSEIIQSFGYDLP